MVLADVSVDDFDRFWESFSTPNHVHVLFDWDESDCQQFMQDPEAAEIMRAAGLQGKPDSIFVEPVGATDS